MGQLRCDCEKTPPPQKKHSQVGPTLANFQLTISSDVGNSDIHKAFYYPSPVTSLFIIINYLPPWDPRGIDLALHSQSFPVSFLTFQPDSALRHRHHLSRGDDAPLPTNYFSPL